MTASSAIVSDSDIVTVPDLSATELTAALRRECNLTYVDPDQAVWDFYVDLNGKPVPGRGKTYEAVVWKPSLQPGERISSEAVRRHFHALRAFGNVGAFEAWLRQVADPTGYYATVPEDAQCWRDPAGGYLFAPYSIFDGGHRHLIQSWVGRDWGGCWSFVGFREIN